MSGRAHWLNAERLRVYPRLFVALFAAVAAGWMLRSHQLVDAEGKPLGYDFLTFYAAAKMAWAGHAAQAYSIPAIAAAEHAIVPASDKVFAWFYPPAFFLLVLWLPLLPYLAAYAAWILGTLAIFLWVFRRVTAESAALWGLAGFSGLWVNLLHGQNGFLTAAIAAGTLLLLPRRPILAGTLLGLLAIKPHLALVFPLALLAIGAWRAMAAAVVSAGLFTALGAAVFGLPTLRAATGSLGTARQFVESGELSWSKMPTTFAMLRMLHAPVDLAYAGHGLVALAACVAVVLVWRRSADWQLRGAAAMTAALLVSPYLFDYDLAWLAFPIVWLTLVGSRHGCLRGEREILVAAWLLPFAMAGCAAEIHLQPGPVVLGLLLWTTVRRALALPAEHAGAVGDVPGRAAATAVE